MRQVLIAYSAVRLQFYYRNHHFKSIGPGFFGLRRDGRGGEKEQSLLIHNFGNAHKGCRMRPELFFQTNK